MAFPTALYTAHTSSSNETLATQASSLGHAALHNLVEAELVAIETKIGTGSSTPIANTVLRGTGTGTSAWQQVDLANDVSGQLDLTGKVSGILPAANGGTGVSSLGSGIGTFLGTPSSANLAGAMTDETGSGALVFGTSPTITTPSLKKWSGWQPLDVTLTYSSYDATNDTGVMNTSVDLSSFISVGMRLWITNNSATQYCIVTAINTTSITGYFGTDYSLTNATISSPYFSNEKAPYGFPLDPTKWTVSVTDTSPQTQSSPTAGTWYNLGSISITLPIGAWRVQYVAFAQPVKISSSSGTQYSQYQTLSTANNTESDTELTTSVTGNSQAATTWLMGASLTNIPKVISVTSATPYYLNAKSGGAALTSLNTQGNLAETVIRAVCAYL